MCLSTSLAFTSEGILRAKRTTAKGGQRSTTALHVALDRRSLFSLCSSAAVTSSVVFPAVANEAKPKVVVVGGSGWVGVHVDKWLLDRGCDVVSVSRSSTEIQKEKVNDILGYSPPIEYASLDASSDDLTDVFRGAAAVVSCVGVFPGGANQRDGNGAVNVRIADAAKTAGADHFVYISVASDITDGPAKYLFGDYVKGKKEAEAGVLRDFGERALVLKPAVIEGGPPHEFHLVQEFRPPEFRRPSPPRIKPVPVEAIARVAAEGALGTVHGRVIDGNKEIMEMAIALGGWVH